MPPKARDVAKTRAARLGEVFTDLHEKTGQANSQLVAFGGNLIVGSPNTTLGLSDTCAVLGQAVIDKPAVASIAAAPGPSTAAGQFRKVLVELAGDGSIVQTVGNTAGSQAAAVKPD